MARRHRVRSRLVPKRPPFARRLATAARWAVGVGLTSWSYMWRTTPMHRREEAGALADDAPPDLPDGVSREEGAGPPPDAAPPAPPDAASREEVQSPSAGPGPLFHRRYSALVREPRLL